MTAVPPIRFAVSARLSGRRPPEILLLALLTSASALASAAAGADGTDQEARRIFHEGVRSYERGSLVEALDAFQRAYALRPSFRILFNIGQAQAELGRPHRAVEAFEGYLAEGGERIAPDRRRTVEQELARLSRQIARVRFEGPEGAELWIDGERKGYLPLAGPVLLQAGSHRLDVRHGREEPCTKKFAIEGGVEKTESCTPPPAVAVVAPPPPPVNILSPSPGDNRPLFSNGSPPPSSFFIRSVAPWLAAGLGAAALAAGIGCAWKTSSLDSSLDGACPDGTCPPSRESDVEALPRWAAASDALFASSAVMGAAALLLFLSPWESAEEPTDAGDRP
ncbi:MAG: hypothetical protein PHU25_19190 [Deltaproteobacteria bacterium]|nr:hypothetical protein [Deltaproteobacteria bacterium]